MNKIIQRGLESVLVRNMKLWWKWMISLNIKQQMFKRHTLHLVFSEHILGMLMALKHLNAGKNAFMPTILPPYASETGLALVLCVKEPLQ